ncbi:uridine-cytidine kinase 2-like [Sycon ciliatum]|uniref:uridine-cytidine kinase 2-like n=1 Tax=Sycon ciliatum TaxID=27933 RepID=UPI0020ACED4C|eukprot:scpid94016/ scgid28568/ Uridine-cytidine kinase 2; Cytidine monophosphokinase 2; Testis-specific protein TSA903; Uridine monophosphokinase 2
MSTAGGQLAAKKPFLIGVTGGTASGKTEVCRRIVQLLGQDEVDAPQRQVEILRQESFYKELSEEEQQMADEGCYNFDHPDAFDFDRLEHTLSELVAGRTVQVPVYDYGSRTMLEKRTLRPTEVVLVVGILVLYSPPVRSMLHMKLFVDVDSDNRLARRVMRDTAERNRDLEATLHQYTEYVKPAFDDFTSPTKKYADVILPRGVDNGVAINLIGQHIRDILSGGVIYTQRPPRQRTTSCSDGPASTGSGGAGAAAAGTGKTSEPSLSRPH